MYDSLPELVPTFSRPGDETKRAQWICYTNFGNSQDHDKAHVPLAVRLSSKFTITRRQRATLSAWKTHGK